MIGIMGAIPEEVGGIIAALGENCEVITRGMRRYHLGTLWGNDIVAVYSRIGKVAAATTATHLLADFKVDQILFTGVAGGLSSSVNVGDIVVGGDLYQHDMDARPLFERHVIPLLGRSFLSTPQQLRGRCLIAAREFLELDLSAVIRDDVLAAFKIDRPKVVVAGIASGDKFFSDQRDAQELAERLPVACVEMEGAAVAQVCHEYGVDYAVIRTISDSANSTAHVDFGKFVSEVAANYSYGVIRRLLLAGNG
jgi:adenosylhomocysteine nucleosidase